MRDMSLTLTTDQADQLIVETEVNLARSAFLIDRQAQEFVNEMTLATRMAAIYPDAGAS